MRGAWWGAVIGALVGAGCASGQAVKCKPYEPVIPACSPGFEYRCETTEDGCYVCGCVSIVDDQGRSPMEPPPN